MLAQQASCYDVGGHDFQIKEKVGAKRLSQYWSAKTGQASSIAVVAGVQDESAMPVLEAGQAGVLGDSPNRLEVFSGELRVDLDDQKTCIINYP